MNVPPDCHPARSQLPAAVWATAAAPPKRTAGLGEALRPDDDGRAAPLAQRCPLRRHFPRCRLPVRQWAARSRRPPLRAPMPSTLGTVLPREHPSWRAHGTARLPAQACGKPSVRRRRQHSVGWGAPLGMVQALSLQGRPMSLPQPPSHPRLPPRSLHQLLLLPLLWMPTQLLRLEQALGQVQALLPGPHREALPSHPPVLHIRTSGKRGWQVSYLPRSGCKSAPHRRVEGVVQPAFWPMRSFAHTPEQHTPVAPGTRHKFQRAPVR